MVSEPLSNHELAVTYLSDHIPWVRPDLFTDIPVKATNIAAAIYTTWLEQNDNSPFDMPQANAPPQLNQQRNRRIIDRLKKKGL